MRFGSSGFKRKDLIWRTSAVGHERLSITLESRAFFGLLDLRDRKQAEGGARAVAAAPLRLSIIAQTDCGLNGSPRSGPSYCGEAGKIELFTPEQVEDARRESNFDQYIDAIQRCYDDAPNIARRVIERTKERERQQQEAVDAITTKVDDLPPLPSKRQ